MKNILFIIGKSQYDSTKLFLTEMAEALKDKEFNVDILTAYDEEDFVSKRKSLDMHNYHAIFTVNGMALEPGSTLGRVLLQNNVLYCTMLMDHPYIHHRRLQNQYEHIFVMSPDMEHTDYLDRYYSNIRYTGFLPHAGCRAENIRPYSEREIPVSFMGSYSAPEMTMKQIKSYPPQMSAILQETIQLILSNPQYSVNQAVYILMHEKGAANEHTNFADICPEFHTVDTYIRRYYRDKVIRTIAEAGIPIDVYGDGWEQMHFSGHTNLHIHPRIDFKDSLEITGNSKISLNIMPWFKAGSHDRVFSAMLCGSLCLTDSSIYLEQACTSRENILFYSLEQLETLPGIIEKTLADEKRAAVIARKGQALAEEKHTWANRAEEFIDYLAQIEQS